MSKVNLIYFGVNEILDSKDVRHAIIELDYNNFVFSRYCEGVKLSFASFVEISQVQTDGEQIFIKFSNSQK